jgi:branched-chain amino acid transport system substrate-binding protein
MMRAILIGMVLAAAATASAAAQIAGDIVKIGVLTDQSGNFSALSGAGSVAAAEMAAADFGGSVAGKPILVINADHQNKTDIGLAIARRWYEADGVQMIVDVPNSAIMLGVQEIAREHNRVLIVSGGGTADFTNKACSPVGIHWSWDTYAYAVGFTRTMLNQGYDSWFFLTADFAFGTAMQRDATAVIQVGGGKVVGAVRHPLGNADFSSFLLQAQASGAKIVALANGGDDTINAIKQASEFGLTERGQKLVALAANITDIHALGLKAAQGLILVDGFYWDRDEETRAWSKRFFAKRGAMPTLAQAGVYSAVTHYLKAVAAAKTDEAKTVVAQMKAMPVDDFFAHGGTIRADGRMVHDIYLIEVKTPAEQRYDWDYYKILRTIPGEQAFRPLAESECPLVKK